MTAYTVRRREDGAIGVFPSSDPEASLFGVEIAEEPTHAEAFRRAMTEAGWPLLSLSIVPAAPGVLP